MADPISASIAAIVTAVGTTTAVVAAGASQLAFALGASAATSFTIGAAAASAFKLAGITALSVAANALFAPSLGAGGAPTDWVSDPDAGVPFIAGRLGVGGNLVYSREFGPDARYLGNVTVYSAAGPVHSMGPFYADGVNITFGSGGVATNGGNIAGNMWLSSQDGLQPQPTALPLPGGLTGQTFTGWTANHKLSGFAADLQVLRQDSKFKTYPAGQPRRWRVIEGIKVYDPRLDSTYPGGDGPCRVDDRSTYVYSTSPILHALQWAIGYYANGKPIAGLADPAGPNLAGIDVAAFVSAANVAEANGWTVGARYSTADDKHQVLLGFLQAGGALYAENAGRISCVTRGAVKTSVMTLSRADTAGPVSIDTMPPRRMVINSLIPKCVLEAHQWEAVDLDPVTVAALEAADGELRRRGKSYPFVTNGVQASQLAALDILDAREPLSGTASFKPYVRDLKPGDAFTWDEPGYLLNGVKCVVMDRSYDPATDRVEITWRSETDGKIAYALGLDPALPAYPGLTPTNPSFVPVPRTEDWTPEGDSIGTPGGPRGPVIRLIGETGDLTGVTHVLVFYRVTGDTDWTLHGEFPLADFEQEDILGLLPDTDHDVRLIYRNAWGVINPEQERIFPEIRTGPQITAAALAAAAGSELAQEIAASVRAVRREGQGRLAEAAALFSLIRSEADARADDDSVLRFDLINAQRTAGNASVLAQDIVQLNLSSSTPLVQRFSVIEATLDDPVTGLDSKASQAQLAIVEATAQRATARLLTDLQASLASALSTIQSLQEVTSDENSSSALRIDQTRAQVGAINALVQVLSDAYVDTSDPSNPVARAIWQVLVEASGSDPAILALRAGDGVSDAIIAATRIVLANLGAGEDEILPVLTAIGGVAHIARELRLGTDAALTQYTGSNLDIALGKDPVTAKRGLFMRDSAGDPLLIANMTDQVFQLFPAMAVEGFAGVESVGFSGSDTWMKTTAPTTSAKLSDFNVVRRSAATPIPKYASSQFVYVSVSYSIAANADLYQHFYYRHRVYRRTRASAGEGIAAAPSVTGGDVLVFEEDQWHSVGVATGATSGNARTANLEMRTPRVFEFRHTAFSAADHGWFFFVVIEAIAGPGSADEPAEGWDRGSGNVRFLNIKNLNIRVSAPRPGVVQQ